MMEVSECDHKQGREYREKTILCCKVCGKPDTVGMWESRMKGLERWNGLLRNEVSALKAENRKLSETLTLQPNV